MAIRASEVYQTRLKLPDPLDANRRIERSALELTLTEAARSQGGQKMSKKLLGICMVLSIVGATALANGNKNVASNGNAGYDVAESNGNANLAENNGNVNLAENNGNVNLAENNGNANLAENNGNVNLAENNGNANGSVNMSANFNNSYNNGSVNFNLSNNNNEGGINN